MSRRSVDTCLFCGEVPCVCTSEKSKLVKSSRTESKPQVEVQPYKPRDIQAIRSAMKKAADRAPKPPPPPPKHGTEKLSTDELVWQSAIRSLAPILHEEELVNYRGVLTSRQSPEERAMAWKLRREADNETKLV